MKRPALLLALLFLALPALAPGAALLQPQSGSRGLQIEVSQSRAWLLEANGQRLRLPLRRGEEITEMVEFEGGWAAAGDRALGSRRELAVVVEGAAGVERLPAIPEQAGALRVRPVPMASTSRFEGLAWLEGDRPAGYEVRVSDWTGATWTPPLTVAAARRGGQAGLAGTVLDDGRWLLVWSASDGRSSELQYALRDGGRWTPPRPLAPADLVPDVTPTLVRAPGGALLVWARRQGAAYRLQAARFGQGWGKPQPLGGAGWSPRFADLGDDGRFLLHRSATGWAALELDATGRALRRSEIAGEIRQRPVVSASGGALAVRWQRGERATPIRWQGAP